MVHWYQLQKWDNLRGGGTPLFGPNGYVLLWSVSSLQFLFLNGVYNFTIIFSVLNGTFFGPKPYKKNVMVDNELQ